jgi:hypothetical protein
MHWSGLSSSLYCSQQSAQVEREVVRRDAHAFVQVQPVRGLALGANAGIEVDLVAAEAPGLVLQPIHERPTVAAAAEGGAGRQVVHIQREAPREEVACPETGNGNGLVLALLEGG